MKKIILIPFILLFWVACKNTQDDAHEENPGMQEAIAFDASKWKIKKDSDYLYRKGMIDDLVRSNALKKLDKAGILVLLGEPERIENNHLFYQIDQDRIGSWPVRTKTLVIKMENDSVVEWVKIHG
ncbi:hypothetical protein [Flavobacterium sp.]